MYPDHINTITALKRAFRDAGNHFFEPDTMRFFRSKLARDLHPLPDGRVLFITSEQFIGSDFIAAPRRYTVRCATFVPVGDGWDVDVSEPFGFQHAATLQEARRMMRRVE